MAGLLLMLPLAILIALVFLGLFFWSLRNGDYEDPEMAKYRMLLDEDESSEKKKQSSSVAPGAGDSG